MANDEAGYKQQHNKSKMSEELEFYQIFERGILLEVGETDHHYEIILPKVSRIQRKLPSLSQEQKINKLFLCFWHQPYVAHLCIAPWTFTICKA
ncbi:uncharacterized protein LOC136034025 isoform X3 [Artemia franciscana]|uniref:uncharacterized protein LOC136034025 isoform X3 n=1 Tax=Artemia franciscana TaxID=6661 RepID=UPI0032D9C072